MSEKPVIGFIGVGHMGHGMATNILKNDYPLWIKGNRNRTPVDDLVSKGANEAHSPRELAEKCDIIHLCLSNSAQVESVFHGSEGILAGAREGLIVIDSTTSDPVSTRALARELKELGGKLIDAPLGRTPKEAQEGTLDAMVGADATTFEKVRPVIECWAGVITHVGNVGNGHTMKLMMNLLSMGYAALYAEAIVLATKSGLTPQSFRDVIGASRLSNGFFETFMRYAVDRDGEAHKFSITNAAKDLRYANALSMANENVNIMASAARHYFAHAEAIGLGEDYVITLTDIVGRLNGVDMGQEVEKGKKAKAD